MIALVLPFTTEAVHDKALANRESSGALSFTCVKQTYMVRKHKLMYGKHLLFLRIP